MAEKIKPDVWVTRGVDPYRPEPEIQFSFRDSILVDLEGNPIGVEKGAAKRIAAALSRSAWPGPERTGKIS